MCAAFGGGEVVNLIHDHGGHAREGVAGGAVFAIVAALVAGVAVVGMNPQILPAPARKMIEDLRKQFHI